MNFHVNSNRFVKVRLHELPQSYKILIFFHTLFYTKKSHRRHSTATRRITAQRKDDAAGICNPPGRKTICDATPRP